MKAVRHIQPSAIVPGHAVRVQNTDVSTSATTGNARRDPFSREVLPSIRPSIAVSPPGSDTMTSGESDRSWLSHLTPIKTGSCCGVRRSLNSVTAFNQDVVAFNSVPVSKRPEALGTLLRDYLQFLSSDPNSYRNNEAAAGFPVLNSLLEVAKDNSVTFQFSDRTLLDLQSFALNDGLPDRTHIEAFDRDRITNFESFTKALQDSGSDLRDAQSNRNSNLCSNTWRVFRRATCSGILGTSAALTHGLIVQSSGSAPWYVWGGLVAGGTGSAVWGLCTLAAICGYAGLRGNGEPIAFEGPVKVTPLTPSEPDGNQRYRVTI